MNEEIRILRKELGIDDWLELAKEDKNLKGAYISFGQYIDILEKREKQLQNNWNELKKYLQQRTMISIFDRQVTTNVLNKMQELEQGKGEE